MEMNSQAAPPARAATPSFAAQRGGGRFAMPEDDYEFGPFSHMSPLRLHEGADAPSLMAVFYYKGGPGTQRSALLPIPTSLADAKKAVSQAFGIGDDEAGRMELFVDMASVNPRCEAELVGLREQSWALVERAKPFHWHGPLRFHAVVQ